MSTIEKVKVVTHAQAMDKYNGGKDVNNCVQIPLLEYVNLFRFQKSAAKELDLFEANLSINLKKHSQYYVIVNNGKPEAVRSCKSIK